MKNQKCNIFYLQESHFTNSSTESLQHEFKGEMLHSYGNSQSRGVSIFIKDNLNCILLDSFKDNDGRLLIVNVEIDDNLYTLVNIYAPNTPQNRNAFFKKVKRLIEEKSLGLIILGGDMNEILSTNDTKTRNENT